MKPYREMSKEELASLKEQLTAVYKEYQGKNLSLNMDRGKPSPSDAGCFKQQERFHDR